MVTIIKVGFELQYNFTLAKLANQDIPARYLKDIDTFLRNNLKGNKHKIGYSTVQTDKYKIELSIQKLKENCYHITFIKIIKRGDIIGKRYFGKSRRKNKIESYTNHKRVS